MDGEAAALLEAGVQKIGFCAGAVAGSAPCRTIVDTLARYVNEIETFNGAYGLVGCAGARELVVKHVLDSLAAAPILAGLHTGAASVADAGSGAGLPGVPLAVALPRWHVTLIERMERRADFLLNTRAVLGLTNITVAPDDIETLPAKQPCAAPLFDLIVFRAFKPLTPKLYKSLCRRLSAGGALAAYKGRMQAIQAEMAALRELVPVWHAEPCAVPFLAEDRHIVIIKPGENPA